MTRRIFTLMLALVLTAGLFPVGSLAADLKFVDVSPEAWYYNDVKTAVDTELVNGKTETTYCPDDFLTYAEAVKLAACMHQKNETGTVSLVNGNPWYQSYVDYAKMKGIIAKDYDWGARATRAGYMAIFAHALPDASLTAKNEVPDGSIPDVSTARPEAAEIYKLYRAGILQGSDDTYNGAWTKHLCKPDDNIKRSEVAAILTRMMFVDKRISFSMAETPTDALKITKQPADALAKVGVSEKASFTVAASGGKSPYTYQWFTRYKDTGDVTLKDNDLNSGTATATLTLTNIRDMDDGSLYWCVITDAAGTKVTSSSAKLSVLTDALKITKQPDDYAMKSSTDNPSFAVTVSGGKAPYTYGWHIETDQYGGTGPSRTKTETTDIYVENDPYSLAGDGDYIWVWCRITDANGATVDSAKVNLYRYYDNSLKITKQPDDYAMKSSTDIPFFAVTVSGGKAPYTYGWHIETDQYGGTGPSRTKTETTDIYVENDPYSLAGDGDYIWVWCRITDANGATVDSGKANLYRYYDNSLKIAKQPQNVTIDSPGYVTLEVSVTGGTQPYTFQWQSESQGEWQNISGSTDGTNYSKLSVNAYSAISWVVNEPFRCIIKDANGQTVTSDVVRVNLNGAELRIKTQPNSYWASEGQDVTFTVEVEGGTKPYKYDWQWRDYKTDWNSYTGQGEYGSPTKQIKNLEDWHLYHNEQYQVRCVITDANNNKVITNAVIMDDE